MFSQRILVFNADQSTKNYKYITDSIRNLNVDLFCISELSNKACGIIKNVTKKLNMDCVYDKLDYKNDYMFIGFNKSIYKLINNQYVCSEYGKFISICLENVETNTTFKVVAVHLPRKNIRKELCYKLLNEYLTENIDFPIILLGDFNITFRQIERIFKVVTTIKESTTCNIRRSGIDNICFIRFDVIKQQTYVSEDVVLTHKPIFSHHSLQSQGV
jgi:hypothetical protein